MKALWKGSLNFGLVTIDIELVSAIKEHTISFKLLHDKCETPIRNLHWCPHCDMAVTWDHIVKGLPLGKNKFFVMTKEALRKLKPLRTDTIVIETFLDTSRLEPIWLDQHYYALAHKENDRAYALFVVALENTKKMAIGRVIFKEKEHVCVIQSYHGALLLSTLHYPYEIRPLPTSNPKFTAEPAELELAEYLIQKLSRKKISFELFKDTFVEKLKKALATHAKKTTITAIPEQKKQPKNSLLETLKKSLQIKSKTSRKRA